MASLGGLRLAGAGVLMLTCGLVAGCASPPTKPLATPPPQVVPGVISGGSASPGAPGSVPGAPAGSRGIVTLGGWAPGGARNPVAAGALAYFKWLNAHGGVYGRAVRYQVLDDHGSARIVPSLMHQLVQGDAVFAVFGAQGMQGRAVTSFLDTSGVPDVFSGPGCGCEAAGGRLADVFGWALGNVRDANVLGAWVARTYSGQKVAVAFTPATSRATLAAFVTAAHGVRVARRVPVASASAAAAGVRAAKASGARVLVTFAPQGVVAAVSQAMASQRWSAPLVVVGGSGLAAGLPDGVITDGFLPTTGAPAHGPAGPAMPNWIALFRKIKHKYLTRTPLTPAVIDGMSSAYEMAQALLRAGPNLTRPGLIAALNGMPSGPSAAPLALTTQDHGGAQGGYIGVFRGGALVPLSGVWVTTATSGGAVTPYAGTQVVAPANGMPQP